MSVTGVAGVAVVAGVVSVAHVHVGFSGLADTRCFVACCSFVLCFVQSVTTHSQLYKVGRTK